MLTYVVEPWATVRGEIGPLWRRHYAEIAADQQRIALDPDFARYSASAANGSLHIVVAREAGQMVGYVFAFVETHLHYRSTLCGFYDIYWLAPEARKGSAGVKLLKEAERTLKARGVKKIFTGTKLWKDVGRIFERHGWNETERLYSKWIGD